MRCKPAFAAGAVKFLSCVRDRVIGWNASSYGWMDAGKAVKGAEKSIRRTPGLRDGPMRFERRETFSQSGTSFTDRQRDAAFLHSN